ncbi:MAG: HAMP domain-containing sensor histidine kinase [Pseudomonadota bacterium]
MKRRSALFRLVAAIAAGTTLLAALGAFTIYRTVEREAQAQLQALLEADLKGFADLYAQRRTIAVREGMERRIDSGTQTDQQIFLLLDQQDDKLGGNVDDMPTALSLQDDWVEFTLDNEDGESVRYRGSATELPGGFPLMNARATTQRDELVRSVARISIIAVLLIAGVAVLLGWLVCRPILQRIDHINAVLADVETGHLDRRADMTGRADEFGRLGANINRTLDRVQDLNRQTLSLADHIAHELRTPFNRLKLAVARLSKDAASNTADVSQSIETINSEIDQTVSVFEALLDISQTEADARSQSGFAPRDLSTIVQDVAALYTAVAEEKGIALQLPNRGAVMVLGDDMLLMRLIANLLDNAIKFTPQGGKVTITLRDARGKSVFTIADTGPGVAADFRDDMFRRFVRAPQTQNVPGHGLGLALVKAIAVRHGARLSLPDVKQGFAIELSFPAMDERVSP